MNTQAQYQKRVILAGGSGFLGNALATYFNEVPSRVTILTRHPRERTDYVREIAWDGQTLGPWVQELDGADVVINLTGRSVDCRYTPENRKEILESRVFSTRVIGAAIAQCKHPPDVWLNSSTATLYQHTFGPPHDESSRDMDSAIDAKDAFSVEVAQAWEAALNEANTPRTRKVALRTSMVLGLGKNSVFPVLRRLTKLGLGGRQGSGKQFVSWIHQ
ncbi:MAG TPA: NAD-dependent epimerase/dehydratase family protein, partial [Verrucomicrobiae bacterium]|nr:NAD-dependent epimerase/dehydratase family protein [Verrucomicrobiae bacterium]